MLVNVCRSLSCDTIASSTSFGRDDNVCVLWQGPWGSVSPAAPPLSLADVMSEQLASQLQEEDVSGGGGSFPSLSS